MYLLSTCPMQPLIWTTQICRKLRFCDLQILKYLFIDRTEIFALVTFAQLVWFRSSRYKVTFLE
jgi:hypothetical protein